MTSWSIPMGVSVVIPAYNAARFLPEAIASVRAQTRPVAEIIVVDDGSADNTQQVIESLGEGITYLRQSNAGVSATRNRGMALAQGEYIAFLDADDRWLPNKIEKQLAIFHAHPDVALVATDRSDVGPQDQLLLASLFERQSILDEFTRLAGNPIPQGFRRIVEVNFLPTSSVVVRKAALDEVGGFATDIRYGEDMELWARIAAKYQIVCLPEVLVHYRLHDTNATQATERLLSDMVRVMERIRGWGGDKMRAEGMDPEAMVARNLWELGYWHFHQGNPSQARSALWRSFQEKPGLRPLAFAAMSLLPRPVVRTLRRLKQQY